MSAAQMQYTPAQRCAVYYPDGDLLISAAAGSGKTASLTARIVELCVAGRASLGEMLIVTFTKAAASEMKRRISAKLADRLKSETEPEVRARIAAAIAEAPSAQISTIDSFLYRILKPQFAKLGLSPDASIADENVMGRLRETVMRDLVDDLFADRGELGQRFLRLADVLGQARDSEKIDRELLELAAKLRQTGREARVFRLFAADLGGLSGDEPLCRSAIGRELLAQMGRFCGHYRRVFGTQRERFVGLGNAEKVYGPTLEAICGWLDWLTGVLDDETATFAGLKAVFLAYSEPGSRLPRLPKDDACEVTDDFRTFRDELKEERGKIADIFFAGTAEEVTMSAGMTAALLETLSDVIGMFEMRFSEKKRSLGILDYGDLSTLAHTLFVEEDGEFHPTEAALAAGAPYKYLFIDEYQDTNRVQDEIFRAIAAADGVRFLVGDIKQSIYRFRGADPRVFSAYRLAWTKRDPETEPSDSDPHSLFMSENFRCAKPVIDFTNAVSRYLLPHGTTPYEPADDLIYAKTPEPGAAESPAELVLIEKPRKTASSAEPVLPDPEPVYVAGRIAGMIGRYDGSRILTASDFAILLRSPSVNGEAYRQALADVGVNASLQQEKRLDEYPSVMLLTCLLRFVDNPLYDIYTAGALRSPVFGFTLTELTALRQTPGTDPGLPLYTAVLTCAENPSAVSLAEDDPLCVKCRTAAAFVREQKTLSRGMRADKYVESLLQATDFYAIEGIRGNGAERDAVARILAAARAYTAGVGRSDAGLSGLVAYLDEVFERGASRDEDRSKNGVAILSIHASKGLEYPVVFLAECDRRRNLSDESRTVLFDDALGFGMTLTDPTGLVKCDTLIRRVIAGKIARDSAGEEMRMLYVAMTRAQSRLILTGTVANAEDYMNQCAVQAEFADAYHVPGNLGGYLTWVTEALTRYPQPDAVKLSVVTEAEIREMALSQDVPQTDAPENGVPERDADEAELERIRGEFAFRYPADYLARVPAKLTVSRLHPRILDDSESTGFPDDPDDPDADSSGTVTIDPPAEPSVQPEFTLRRPAFLLGEQPATGAEIGTATHVFLQFVDYEKLAANGVESEIDRLTENRFLASAQAKLINRKQMERFRESALLEKLLRSPMVKREFRFNVRLAAERFTAEAELAAALHEHGDRITVQGVVDCVYRDPEDGGLRLVDYKTDGFTAEEWKNPALACEKLRRRHGDQLRYYREICEAMFGEPIRETLLYSTALGRCVKL